MVKGRKQATNEVQPEDATHEQKLNADGNPDSIDDNDYQPVNYSNEIISKQTSIALLYLLFYSTLMFTLPFGAFYATRYILDHYFDVSIFANTGLSVLAAVIVVNSVILAYAYHAYHEPEYDNEGNKLDPSVLTVPKIPKKKSKASKEL